jgi:hypothetical protein
MTPHELAEIIRRAHAIGERKENQVGIENYPREWQDMIVAALEAFGDAQAPVITDEMLNAHIKALGDWAEAFTAERESGVPVDCDISQEDADFFNEEERKRLRIGYEAALAVTSTQDKPLREGQVALERNVVYLAAKEGNLQFWRAQAAQEKAYNTWKSEGFIGECPQLMKGTLVDYIADAVMSSLVPSTQEKPLSFCSRCGGKDPDCYICGTVTASTEGK